MSPEELEELAQLAGPEHAHQLEPGSESTHYAQDLFGETTAQDLARCQLCGAVYELAPRAPGLFDEEHK